MASLPWALFTERAVGKGHPTLSDTVNRALRQLLSESGYDPDATTFPGLMGPVFNVKAFGTTKNSAMIQGALNAAQAAAATYGGATIVVPSDIYTLDTPLTLAAPGNIAILGLGKSGAKFINAITGSAADPALAISVEGTYYLIQGIWFAGNNQTGAAGNGHAIALIDPAGGFFAPQQVVIRDCRVEYHRGTGKDNTGAAIDACGVYAYGGTGAFIDKTVVIGSAMGVRFSNYTKGYIHHSSFDTCDKNCVYIDGQSESIGVANSILNGSGDGSAKAGLVYINDAEGVSLHGNRLKNGYPYLVNVSTDIGGRAVTGLSILGGTAQQLDVAGGHTAFAFSNAIASVVIEGVDVRFVNTMTDAIGVLVNQVAGGYEATGLKVAHNTFSIGNGGTIASGIKLNVTSNKVVAPVIEGNTFGRYNSGGFTITSAVELRGFVDSARIRGNTFVAVTGDTITNAVQLVNGTLTNTVLDGNVYRAFGGTITNKVAQSGGVPYVVLNEEGVAVRMVSSGGAVGFYEGQELSADPAAPATNFGRFYFRDNGSGKTQLVARFPTGAVQVIATEP